MDYFVQLKNINYKYSNRYALKDLSLNLLKGEIHALVGEHRAGKSTVVKLLGGSAKKQSGEIFIQNKKIDNLNPISSMQSEIGIVYQDQKIMPSLNAVENIFAGKYQVHWYRRIQYHAMREKVQDFLTKWKLKINLVSPVSELTTAEQNIIEFISAVLFKPKLLVLDELSNRFNVDEVEFAYKLIQDLQAEGTTILYVTNDMNEIFEFADRVSVLKGGQIISTQDIKAVDKVRLIDLTYSFVTTREELRKKNEELFNYKKYNEDIINNLPVGVMIIDTDRNVYLTNKFMIKLLNMLKTEEKSAFNKLLQTFDPEFSQEITHIIDFNETKSWEEIEFVKDVFIDISILPFKNDYYIPMGTIILIRDVSQDYYFKNYLLQAERISSIAELAAGVAHEVNNPLSIIINYVELLKKQKQDSYNSERLNLIRGELKRIQTIIGSLLSFSRLKETPFKAVDIQKTICDSLLLMTHPMEKKNIMIEKNLLEKQVLVIGNENRLKQVMINLIKNAIEAVHENGYLRIVTKEYADEGVFEVNIANNGDTIAEDILPQIFNPFYSTKADLNNTGLGLSICQHIIENHNGLITCSPSDSETVFTIRLPVC